MDDGACIRQDMTTRTAGTATARTVGTGARTAGTRTAGTRTSRGRTAFLRVLCVCLLVGVAGMSRAAHGQLAAVRGAVPGGYDFWLYAPPAYVESHERTPLIIFLHGASLCGTNMQKVRRYGPIDAISRGRVIPALVVAPQNPGGSWQPKRICAVLDYVVRTYNVDTARVYVIGMSLGGYGTLDFVGTYPDRIAAAMALCGGCTLSDLSGIGRVPLWIMHGTADRDVTVSHSKAIVTAIRAAGGGGLLRYDWLKGASHGYPARLFYLTKTYDWLLSHSRDDTPRTVNRDITFTKAELKNAYADLEPEETRYDVVDNIAP